MIEENTFLEVGIILGFATVLGFAGQKLKQPLLIMFLVTGVLVGPSCIGIIQSYGQIEFLAHMGIAILLFIVGLKLDTKLIKSIGPVALATGLGQILFTSIIGFMLSICMGLTFIASAYVSIALTFSSTIIIVKLLSDKKEIDSLHGQIAVGFLIVQDIAAILALVGLTTVGSSISGNSFATQKTILFALKGVGFLVGITVVIKYIMPLFVKHLAKSRETLILFSIAWAVFLGALSEWLGFTKEVGAFLAGLSLASTEYRDSIGSRLTTLRDFLILFFFIDLGSRLDWSTVGSQLSDSIVFSLFVLIGNPLIVMAIMGFMGYRRRTGFMAGLTVAQISEFSLIVIALGVSMGHIQKETMGLVTLVGVFTIFLSTYMILYSVPLFNLLSGSLKLFERKNPYRESSIELLNDFESDGIILIGLGNYGSSIAEILLRRNKSFIGIDFDPKVLESWRKRNVNVIYGDISDPEICEHLNFKKIKWIVSTVRSRDLSLLVIKYLRDGGYNGKIAMTALNNMEARQFEQAGCTTVFMPLIDAAEQAVDSLIHTVQFLPTLTDWPMSFLEVRIRSDASIAGKFLKDIPLRTITNTSIIAISRGGKVIYEPDLNFQIYPGDRLVLVGPKEKIKDAEILLNEHEIKKEGIEIPDHFEVAELKAEGKSGIANRTLSEIDFKKQFGVTVIGIRRGVEKVTSLHSKEIILKNDILIVIGISKKIKQLLYTWK